MNLTTTGGRRPTIAALGLILAAWAQAGVAAPVSWQGWTFDYEVSGNNDGLSLLNVTFQGRSVLRKLSFPVVRVFYDGDACGPYADRLGGSLSPIPWAGNATLAQRQFTLNGQLWYEIGIRDQIGSYDLYHVYYLGADGTIDAHLYSKGLQCVANHIHYPDWRFDFDLDGPAEDQILRDTGTGFAVVSTEFDFDAASATSHAWRVRDATTGFHVDVLPGFPDFVIPDDNTTVPVTAYSNNTVFGRVYHLGEDEGWEYGPINQVPFNDRESIASADTVLWYEGYLPHSAAEGSELWHSTGVRLFVDPAGSPPPEPPEPPPPTQIHSYAGGVVAILDLGAGSPYPSTVSVPVLGGTVSKVTVRIDGLTHTYPTDIDLALVGPLGQAVMLMSDVGGGDDVNGVSLTFAADAFAALPGGAIVSGVFRPTNSGASDTFLAPAPAGPYGTNLGVFNNLAPNGTWGLYVKDDEGSDVGSIANWVLTIETSNGTPPPDADSDGVVDNADNCTLQANPTQLDADNDGYGNLCDADLNNSGTVSTADYGILRSVLGEPASASATAAAADINGSGTVTAADVGLLRLRLGTPVGPSGLHP
jgi:subtilisin-like proprotein convertase family protein